MNISDLRKEYIKHTLDLTDTGPSPLMFFRKWLGEAIGSDAPEPTAMSLSTISSEGKPSSRIVLLKGIDQEKFVFFSNYHSHKGQQISDNPNVSLLFFWPVLERQVRIEGLAERIPSVESDKYFNSRPLESRIGAVASPQSKVIENRQVLEKMFGIVADKFNSAPPARPLHWGGYAVIPELIEFWQGRASRMHDRIRFRLKADEWIGERLAP